MNKYLIIIEKSETGYSAYSPDLPGCVSTGTTLVNTEANMKEAIEFHIEGMIEEGIEIPKPLTKAAEFISIPTKRTRNRSLVTA